MARRSSSTDDPGWVLRHIASLRFLAMSLVVLPLVAVLFIASPTPVVSVSASPGMFLFLAIVVVIGTVLRIALSDRILGLLGRAVAPLQKGTHGDNFEGPVEAELPDYYLARFFDSQFAGSATESMAALLSPPSVTSRVSERHVLGDERSEVSVTRTVRSGKALTLVPVLRRQKGELVGSMKVDLDGTATRTLPFDETKGLLLVMLYLTFEAVDGPGTTNPLLDQLAALVVARHPPALELLAEVMGKVESLCDSRPAVLNEDREALRKIALGALSCDFVFAIAPKGCADPRRVRVEYQETYPGGARGVTGRFRRAVGLGRRDYSFDLRGAGESRSYHLNIEGPSGMYVENSFANLPFRSTSATDALPARRGLRTRDEMLMVGVRAGDQFAHLYMRDFDGNPRVPVRGSTGREAGANPRFQIELREKPPGFLGPILAVSFWLFALTWVVGIFHDEVFPSSGQIGSSWPTLIFGVPAIVVGWLLSRTTSETLRVISVPTFLCLTWLSADAAALVTFAALKSSGIKTGPWDLGPLHVEHTTWTIMMIATALNLVVCGGLFLVRTLRYASTINERSAS